MKFAGLVFLLDDMVTLGTVKDHELVNVFLIYAGMGINTTFTLEPTITDSNLILICFKTSSYNIYSFPTVYSRL